MGTRWPARASPTQATPRGYPRPFSSLSASLTSLSRNLFEFKTSKVLSRYPVRWANLWVFVVFRVRLCQTTAALYRSLELVQNFLLPVPIHFLWANVTSHGREILPRMAAECTWYRHPVGFFGEYIFRGQKIVG